MSLDPQRRTIDGLTFDIRPLAFSPARRTLVRLSKVLGPPLAALVASSPSLEAVRAEVSLGSGGGLSEGVAKLAASVDDDFLQWLEEICGKQAQLVKDDGKKPFLTADLREQVFEGRMLTYFRWLGACLEVSYGDFFSVLRGPSGGASSAKGGAIPD